VLVRVLGVVDPAADLTHRRVEDRLFRVRVHVELLDECLQLLVRRWPGLLQREEQLLDVAVIPGDHVGDEHHEPPRSSTGLTRRTSPWSPGSTSRTNGVAS
jgi:hypothetical protein